MPLSQRGRDREQEAGADPIPHPLPLPSTDSRDKRGVRGEGDPVRHQFLALVGLGAVPCTVALQEGLFPAGRLCTNQEGVWGTL